jgi:hypothetical protein
MSIDIPDPQLTYRESLDNAFWDWAEDNSDHEDTDYFIERWNNCVPDEPLVYTYEDLYEMDPDIDEAMEVANHAMSKDIQSEINQKRSILQEIKREYN